jgi:hypothetical protein
MINYRGPEGDWRPMFAWKPVRDIRGRWHWFSVIYRREKNRIVWPHQGYEYGTGVDFIIDALRNS